MLIKRKLSLVFLFILFTTSCDLSNGYVKPEELEEPEEPRVEYKSSWLYNEDGTKFTGSGKMMSCYTKSDGDTVESLYTNVTNGEYGRTIYTYYKGKVPTTTFIDPPPYVRIYRIIENCGEPLFKYKPQNYNDSNISINISNMNDNVDCTNPKSIFWTYKFYGDNDTPGEYKLVVDMAERRDKNGYITERLFRTDFFSYEAPQSIQYLKGELKYTQELNDLRNNKKEKADVTIKYDMDIFSYIYEELYSHLRTAYIHAVYTVIEETSNYIYYRADVTVFISGDEKYNIKDWNFNSTDYTLIDKNFRMRP